LGRECSLSTLTIEAVGPEWNRLALLGGSPFLTREWIGSWWEALGDGDLVGALVRADDGALRGGALCRLSPTGELTGTTEPLYSYDWNVVAEDDAARRDVWDAIARFGPRRIHLTLMPDRSDGAGAACEALERGGYRIVRSRSEVSPYLPLPDSWDELLGSISRNLRHKVRRTRRALERKADLVLRTARNEAEVERDLDVFLELEAAGWKGRAGTAILCDPRAERLFRSFALAAARQRWMRLSILESGGTPIAAAYGCAFAGRAFRLKSAFDERFADDSPGLVLLAEELRRSIDEGLTEYDFLGSAEFHKLRWGSQTRDRITVRGYRGALTLPAYAYRARLRPLARRARRRIRRQREHLSALRVPARPAATMLP
jgi:CelD/BcsL family acetyltransferase involved in cellulose biosynthesis